MASHKNFFTKEQETRIVQAIKDAELNTSGEIRLHVEDNCRIDVLDRAAFIFDKLDMNLTALRNGVLFYLAVKDRKFAILGDIGINMVVPPNFWDEIKSEMLEEFKNNNFCEGLIKGILKAGDQLKAKFPYQDDDINELSDEISYGE